MSTIGGLRTIERPLDLITVEVGREHRKAVVRDTIFELLSPWRHRVSGNKEQDRWTEAYTVLTAAFGPKRRERGRLPLSLSLPEQALQPRLPVLPAADDECLDLQASSSNRYMSPRAARTVIGTHLPNGLQIRILGAGERRRRLRAQRHPEKRPRARGQSKDGMRSCAGPPATAARARRATR